MNNLINKYLNSEEQKEFLGIIKPIIESDEFKKRSTKEYMHHSDITLASHILEVAILTYKKSKKILKKNPNFRIDLAIKIAALHDLYTIPWQNNKESNVKHFFNKHGFRHPIEVVINAINWYPELFKDDKEAEILIDGIIHHMYPFPVRVYSKTKELELKKVNTSIDEYYIDLIIKSTKRFRINNVSFARSKYLEGRVVSSCDKKATFKDISNL